MKSNVFLTTLILLLLFINVVYPVFSSPGINRWNVRSIEEFLDRSSSNILKHVYFFSSLKSRVTGYAGYYEATSYIYNFFKKHLDRVSFQNYTLLSPIGEYSLVVKLNGVETSIRLYPLLPNGFAFRRSRTIEGEFVYVGSGELSAYNGIDLDNKVVLIDFKTRMNWLRYGCMLGPPKAFIFIEPYEPEELSEESTASEFTRKDVEGQYVSIPLSIPRFYARFEEIKPLLLSLRKGASVKGRIKGIFSWKKVDAYNIVGLIRGTSLPDEVIVIASHYDSYSVIPALSPGADESLSISVLLELARFFSENRPKRSILFVALSGHWEGLAGAREFVRRIVETKDTSIRLFIYLSLSAWGDDIAILHAGRFYFNPTSGIEFYRAGIIDRLNYYLSALKIELYGGETSVDSFIYPGYAWLNIVYGDPLAVFDSEVYTLAGGYGLAFHTPSLKFHWGTPYDDYAKFEEAFRRNVLGKNKSSLKKAAILAYLIANDEEFRIPPPRYRGFDPNYGGFCTIRGRVLVYNLSTGWYTPVPNAIVRLRAIANMPNSFGLGIYGGLPKIKEEVTEGYYSTSGFMMCMTDENGEFIFYGISPSARTGTSYLPSIEYRYVIEACLLNEDGEIEYFTDYGVHRRDIEFTVDRQEKYVTHVIFHCGSIVFYSIIEPETMSPPMVFSIKVREVGSHTTPQFYGGIFYSFHEGYPVFIAFANPDTRVELVIISKNPRTGEPKLLLILNNLSRGFEANYGRSTHVKLTFLEVARDLYAVNMERYLRLKKQGIRNMEIEDLLFNSKSYIEQAERRLAERKYDFSIALSIEAWQMNRAIREKLYYEDLNIKASIIFIFILLVPFVYLFEKLVFASKTIGRQIARIAAISLLTLTVLYILHPAFSLMEDIFLLFLSTLMAVLMFPTLAILFTDFVYTLGILKRKIRGPHFMGISRSGAILMAFSVGVAMIRRRKTRSALIFAALVTIILGLIIFSFPASALGVIRRDTYVTPSYTGLMIRDQVWRPIPEEVVEQIRRTLSTLNYSYVVSTRVWFYPQGRLEILGKNPLFKGYVSAFLGLGVEEDRVTGVSGLVLSGRWFNETDYYSCIVDEEAVKYLGINVSNIVSGREFIEIRGLFKLKVVGVIDGKLFSSRLDLDGGNFTLIDFKGLVRKVMERRVRLFRYLPTSIVYRDANYGYFLIIVPARLAKDLGGSVYSVAIRIRAPDRSQIYRSIDHVARTLALSLNKTYLIYSTQLTEKKIASVYRYILSTIYVFERWEQLLVPIMIGVLIIFNSMLSNIYERSKEIGIYSALGLSPYHVSGMFLIEAIILSVISSVLGYITGIATAKIVNLFDLLPGIYLNYTVGVPIYSTLLAIAATLLAVCYPLWKVSRMVTPSFERKWKPDTKPVGDEWVITLPFVITTEREAKALMAFIKEFLELHKVQEKAFTVLELSLTTEEEGFIVKAELQMAPYELGIRQEAHIVAERGEKGHFFFKLRLHRMSGPTLSWKRSSLIFVDEIRKQFLIWRGLSVEERRRYEVWDA